MYARHIPVAVFSLGLVVKGESKIGAVFDPFTNNLYTAIKGKGAYKNGEKITANDYELDDMKTVCHYDLWPGADYDTSINFDKYKLVMFTMAKIMEMEQTEKNKIALYVFNYINA